MKRAEYPGKKRFMQTEEGRYEAPETRKLKKTRS